MPKTKRSLAMLGSVATLAALLGPLAGCDHLRSKDANADATRREQEKPKEPVSLVPPSDRYGAEAGANSH